MEWNLIGLDEKACSPFLHSMFDSAQCLIVLFDFADWSDVYFAECGWSVQQNVSSIS
jgi:hypothetical protein